MAELHAFYGALLAAERRHELSVDCWCQPVLLADDSGTRVIHR